MTDPRHTALADLLINHSTRLRPGEHILIEAFDAPMAMTIELVKAARRAKGHPHVALRDAQVLRVLNLDAAEANLDVWADADRHRMSLMDAYIGLRGSHNVSEASDISDDQARRIARQYQKPVHFEQRVNHTKWCVLRWPTPSMAQLAQMSTAAFEDFYFEVCTLDYSKMKEAVQPLVELMNRTDRVHLHGPGDTDLTFSIKDVPAVPCYGESNIPDGECFTAPVRESVNGVIHFNTPTIYHGVSFENVRLEFEDGRIVKSDASMNADMLEAIFDSDDGARFVGEFALGFHPLILNPMKDILFDEKIAGSLHFTPGQAYEDADNGNRSDIHWDLVLIQRPDYGGGRIVFDDALIREDGLFVTGELAGLNPEALT